MKNLFYTALFVTAFLGIINHTQAQTQKHDNSIPTQSSLVLNEQNHKYYWLESDRVELFEISVYNKWGELIYNAKDKSQGWDAKPNGQQLAADIYVYVVKIYREGKWENYTGSIKLIG